MLIFTMVNVTYKPFTLSDVILSVFMLNVVMLSVVSPLSGVPLKCSLLALSTALHQAEKANEGQTH